MKLKQILQLIEATQSLTTNRGIEILINPSKKEMHDLATGKYEKNIQTTPKELRFIGYKGKTYVFPTRLLHYWAADRIGFDIESNPEAFAGIAKRSNPHTHNWKCEELHMLGWLTGDIKTKKKGAKAQAKKFLNTDWSYINNLIDVTGQLDIAKKRIANITKSR